MIPEICPAPAVYLRWRKYVVMGKQVALPPGLRNPVDEQLHNTQTDASSEAAAWLASAGENPPVEGNNYWLPRCAYVPFQGE